MKRADHGGDFDARASDGDIFDTDPIHSPPDRFGSDAPFSFSPSLAIILNASASATPMQRNDRFEQLLSEY